MLCSVALVSAAQHKCVVHTRPSLLMLPPARPTPPLQAAEGRAWRLLDMQVRRPLLIHFSTLLQWSATALDSGQREV